MTDLTKLKVSLTKHGAHKLARLLRQFPSHVVLSKTENGFDGIKIDAAQAARNLSTNKSGVVPAVWDEIRQLEKPAVDALVFLAIAFSHHEIIAALKESRTGYAVGTLRKSYISRSGGFSKEFANIKNDIEELGLAKTSDPEHVSYDLTRYLADSRIGPLAGEIFRLKLINAKWDQENALADECIAQGVHDALAVPEAKFREWIAGIATEGSSVPGTPADVTDRPDPPHEESTPFVFRSGHIEKKTGPVMRSGAPPNGTANLLHNELQSKIYAALAAKHGPKNVGTENLCSGGTSVDIVCQETGGHTFYEIKTSSSCKACIREALPQLLEYAYWGDDEPAKKLVVIGPCDVTDRARRYLKLVRTKFGIPIFYQKIDRETGALSEPS